MWNDAHFLTLLPRLAQKCYIFVDLMGFACHLIYFKGFLKIMYMDEFSVCEYMHMSADVHRDWKRSLPPLEVELLVAANSEM